MTPSRNPPAPKADADSAKRSDRRRVVVGAALAAGAAAAAAVVQRRPEPGATVAASKTDPAAGDGYRLTDHVRRYYETTRT